MFLKSLTSSTVLLFLVSPALASIHAASQQGLANYTQSQIPASLRPALYKEALEHGTSGTHPTASHNCFSVPGQHLQACFDKHGAHFESSSAKIVSLHLEAWGRGSSLHPVHTVAPALSRHQISYKHHQLTEWWRVLPIGFEQGFTIARRHEGNGPLTVILAAGKAVSRDNDSLRWGKLRYGHLVVMDANGKKIPSFISSRGNRILLHIRDKQARYPLTVDPLVWIENKVTASDGATGDNFGQAVALSGNTAMVGANQPPWGSNGKGAVYVFTRLNGVWSQSQKLVASNGATGDEFGCSVAIDGTTAVIGACGRNGGIGSAYVFTESSGIWNQTQELTASGADYFGYSVAISGSTIIVGAPWSSPTFGYQGTAYVFTPSGSTWTQAAQLTASDAASGDDFGWSVGIDGSTAIVGASLASAPATNQGAAYIFTDSGGTWTQAQKLTASDGAKNDDFGNAVSVSGMTAFVGADQAAVNGIAYSGAVYVFSNAGGTWAQAQKLTAGTNSADHFGSSLAVSGATALIGSDGTAGNSYGSGAAFVYTNQSGTWQQTHKLYASDGATNDAFGWSVGLYGSNFLIGADQASVGGNSNQGAAYFYAQSNLGISVSAPPTATQGNTFTSQIIATNNSSAASPALIVSTVVPASTTFVSATPSQGSCNRTSGSINCAIGGIGGNGGTATVNLMLKATGTAKSVIGSTGSIANASPALSAGATTVIITPPSALNSTITDTENTSTTGTMQASDADGEPLTFTVVSQPGHGSVTVTNPSTGAFSYTPASGFTGSDSFTFTANDGYADSNTATVSITVNAQSSGGGGSTGGSSGGGGTGLPALLALGLLAGLMRRRH